MTLATGRLTFQNLAWHNPIAPLIDGRISKIILPYLQQFEARIAPWTPLLTRVAFLSTAGLVIASAYYQFSALKAKPDDSPAKSEELSNEKIERILFHTGPLLGSTSFARHNLPVLAGIAYIAFLQLKSACQTLPKIRNLSESEIRDFKTPTLTQKSVMDVAHRCIKYLVFSICTIRFFRIQNPIIQLGLPILTSLATLCAQEVFLSPSSCSAHLMAITNEKCLSWLIGSQFLQGSAFFGIGLSFLLHGVDALIKGAQQKNTYSFLQGLGMLSLARSIFFPLGFRNLMWSDEKDQNRIPLIKRATLWAQAAKTDPSKVLSRIAGESLLDHQTFLDNSFNKLSDEKIQEYFLKMLSFLTEAQFNYLIHKFQVQLSLEFLWTHLTESQLTLIFPPEGPLYLSDAGLNGLREELEEIEHKISEQQGYLSLKPLYERLEHLGSILGALHNLLTNIPPDIETQPGREWIHPFKQRAELIKQAHDKIVDLQSQFDSDEFKPAAEALGCAYLQEDDLRILLRSLNIPFANAYIRTNQLLSAQGIRTWQDLVDRGILSVGKNTKKAVIKALRSLMKSSLLTSLKSTAALLINDIAIPIIIFAGVRSAPKKIVSAAIGTAILNYFRLFHNYFDDGIDAVELNLQEINTHFHVPYSYLRLGIVAEVLLLYPTIFGHLLAPLLVSELSFCYRRLKNRIHLI